jgi:hypothetical protein
LAARDKRMGVLNELIGAVKFIKFFAWEEKWIQRALDAREFELKWMIKGRSKSTFGYSLNIDVYFFSSNKFGFIHLLWICAPILVSIISFFTYIMLGNELTISVAFTVCSNRLLIS